MRDFAPAAERNKQPIADVLASRLPEAGLVLEVASGTGQHAVAWAAAFPRLSWQPSDPDPEALASIRRYVAEAGEPANLRPPVLLDARAADWPVDAADAVVCVNMIHIAPWSACEGLMRGAARLLPSGAPLVLYGPYRLDGTHHAPSNEAFDRRLREMDPAWGVRDLREVQALASQVGFGQADVLAMPANNHVVVFRHA